jgi:peptide/nickel transport system permease protein
VLTIFGLQLASLMGGSLVTETVFSWPGLGRLLQQSVLNRDFAVVETIVILIACIFVGVNLSVDILYAVINPRIKYT